MFIVDPDGDNKLFPVIPSDLVGYMGRGLFVIIRPRNPEKNKDDDRDIHAALVKHNTHVLFHEKGIAQEENTVITLCEINGEWFVSREPGKIEPLQPSTFFEICF